MKTLKTLAITITLAIASVSPSYAAIEIDESEFGPTYGSMVADTFAGKPLQALTVVGGAATWLLSLPFTAFTGDIDQATNKLIHEPIEALNRCLGCTPAEDRYYKSQTTPDNHVRLVVDGPSEIFINTNQNVVVASPSPAQ